MNIWVYAALLLQMCGMAAGQLLTKEGVRRAGEISLENWQNVILNPFIWSGSVVYVLATVLWLWILSKGDFTALVPFQSLNMVVVVLLGAFIFDEHIGLSRGVGIAIMAVGAFLVAKG